MCVCVCAYSSHRCGQSGSKGHLQVAFQAKQGWNQDEDLCDVPESFPVLMNRQEGGERVRKKEKERERN